MLQYIWGWIVILGSNGASDNSFKAGKICTVTVNCDMLKWFRNNEEKEYKKNTQFIVVYYRILPICKSTSVLCNKEIKLRSESSVEKC